MSAEVELRALVVTQDSGLTAAFMDVSREFGISAQKSRNNKGGVPEELGLSKYEALLIDFETISQTVPILTTVRQSPANRNAVVFAVVGSPDSRQRARDEGATFLLERPLEDEGIRRVLQAAYGLMTSERRRYFRYAVEMAVQIVRDSGEEVSCRTINISGNGIAISSPVPFQLAEKLQVLMPLQESALPIRATGTVVWDDKHGKTGLSMQCINTAMQMKLDSWLDDHFQPSLRQ